MSDTHLVNGFCYLFAVIKDYFNYLMYYLSRASTGLFRVIHTSCHVCRAYSSNVKYIGMLITFVRQWF